MERSFYLNRKYKLKELIGGKMLELKDICFTRADKKILDNINLKIDADKFIVITGPNGSRKINFS